MNRYRNQGITLNSFEQKKAAVSGILSAGVIMAGVHLLCYVLTII